MAALYKNVYIIIIIIIIVVVVVVVVIISDSKWVGLEGFLELQGAQANGLPNFARAELFHSFGAAEAKLLSPKVSSLVWGTCRS